MNWQDIIDVTEKIFHKINEGDDQRVPIEEFAPKELVLEGCRLARETGELGVLGSADDEGSRVDALAYATGIIGVALGWHYHAIAGGFDSLSRGEMLKFFARHDEPMKTVAEYMEEGRRQRERSKIARDNASNLRTPECVQLEMLEKYYKFLELHGGNSHGVFAYLKEQFGYNRETMKRVIERQKNTKSS